MRIPIEFTDSRTRRRQPVLARPGTRRADPGEPHDEASQPETGFDDEPLNTREQERAADPASGMPAPGNPAGSGGPGKPVPGNEGTDRHLSAAEGQESLQNRYLRLRADFDNYRRHAEAEKTTLAEVGKEAVLEDIYPLLDSLGRAIATTRSSGANNGILEGLELVRRDFLKFLEKHGVERIESVGESFDPRLHEAVAAADHPDYPENVVMRELRSGFKRGEKLLRPAQVLISRGPGHRPKKRIPYELHV